MTTIEHHDTSYAIGAEHIVELEPTSSDAVGTRTLAIPDGIDRATPPTDLVGDWDDDSPLPARRSRLMTPASWALIALLIGGGGFVLGAGVGRSTAPKAAAASPTRAGAAGTTGTTGTGARAAGAAATTGAAGTATTPRSSAPASTTSGG